MKFKNLCPHDVEIRTNSKNTIVIPASGEVARAVLEIQYRRTIDGIPIHTRRVKDVVDIPKERFGILYVVSNIIQEQLVDEREDLVSPDRISALMYYGRVKNVEKLVRWT